MEQSERDPEGEKTREKTHKKERIQNQQLKDGSPNPSQPLKNSQKIPWETTHLDHQRDNECIPSQAQSR